MSFLRFAFYLSLSTVALVPVLARAVCHRDPKSLGRQAMFYEPVSVQMREALTRAGAERVDRDETFGNSIRVDHETHYALGLSCRGPLAKARGAASCTGVNHVTKKPLVFSAADAKLIFDALVGCELLAVKTDEAAGTRTVAYNWLGCWRTRDSFDHVWSDPSCFVMN